MKWRVKNNLRKLRYLIVVHLPQWQASILLCTMCIKKLKLAMCDFGLGTI